MAMAGRVRYSSECSHGSIHKVFKDLQCQANTVYSFEPWSVFIGITLEVESPTLS